MAKLFKSLPPVNTLVAFEAACRLGSFSKAANEIARSQASVSRQIRQLEDNLGVRLFERQRHNVVPTAEAESLVAMVRLSLQGLAATAETLRQSRDHNSNFTIFSDISIASGLITPVISEFQRRFPDTSLRVFSSYDSINSISEHFDIGFQVGNYATDRFITEAIADDVIFPVCSPDFARKLDQNLSVNDLTKLPLVHLDDQGRGWPNWADFLTLYGVDKPNAENRLVFDSYQVCLDVAARGDGIALGWARSAQHIIDEGKLVKIPGMQMRLPDCIYSYRPKFAKSTQACELFVDLLRATIQPID